MSVTYSHVFEILWIFSSNLNFTSLTTRTQCRTDVWLLSSARIIEARLVHYSLQAYSMFGVYIIYSFIIYRVRHKWVLCAPQICISFLWLACKKIWWVVANFGGKFKQSMLLWHKAGSWVELCTKLKKNWDLILSTSFLHGKVKNVMNKL